MTPPTLAPEPTDPYYELMGARMRLERLHGDEICIETMKRVESLLADLPGEGMKSAENLAREILDSVGGGNWKPDRYAHAAILIADARRGGPEPRPLREIFAPDRYSTAWVWTKDKWIVKHKWGGGADLMEFYNCPAIGIPKPADIK